MGPFQNRVRNIKFAKDLDVSDQDAGTLGKWLNEMNIEGASAEIIEQRINSLVKQAGLEDFISPDDIKKFREQEQNSPTPDPQKAFQREIEQSTEQFLKEQGLPQQVNDGGQVIIISNQLTNVITKSKGTVTAEVIRGALDNMIQTADTAEAEQTIQNSFLNKLDSIETALKSFVTKVNGAFNRAPPANEAAQDGPNVAASV